MLERISSADTAEKDILKTEIEGLRKALSSQQQQIKEAGLPVVILFEGWGASGKGSMIKELILNIDPRSFSVYSISPRTAEEERKPFLERYFVKTPQRGEFSIFDSGWYGETVREMMEGGLKGEALKRRIESIRTFERQLADDGCLVLKFFLHISKETQAKRFEKLSGSRDTAWRVSKDDKKENRDYEDYRDAWNRLLSATDDPWAGWQVIDGEKKNKRLLVYQLTVRAIARKLAAPDPDWEKPPVSFPMLPMPRLQDVDLERAVISDEEYKAALKEAQEKLFALHNKLYRKRRPVVIVYEGWDAAGKGGNIKRIAAALDPRGYQVVPVAAPDKRELRHHYLWRFWERVPKTGHIAIFDRSWYGRVMVERLEGFCTEYDWKRAYREMNEFEKELSDWGAVVLKFWIHIDKDTQLERFTDRQNTPEKQWKITEEDWRNREKWDLYEAAVDEMLQKTSTVYAPWHIIESKDKKFARFKVLDILIVTLQKALKD